MNIISNDITTNHQTAFLTLCKGADEILMASPFCYPNFAEFANSIKEVSTIHKIVFITTAKDIEITEKIDSLLSFRREMERIGMHWVLRVDNRLHGKIYIFKKELLPLAGIITSANLTSNGMALNHEWGVQIDEVHLLKELEAQIIASAPDTLDSEQLDAIKNRVKVAYPVGIQKSKPFNVVIDDIVRGYRVSEGARIFIKPIGVSGHPIYEGDFSGKTNMYFSKKYPKAVRIGDILIAYAVGGRRIIGAYEVTSNPYKDDNGDPRWPWFVTSKCLTPNLSNHKWNNVCPHVTRIAKDYVDSFNQPITHTGHQNLGALNFGSDKILLDDNYGRYLLSELMEMERKG